MPDMKEIPALIELLQHALTVSEIVERSRCQAELIEHGAKAVEPLLAAFDQGVLPEKIVDRLLTDIWAKLNPEQTRHVLAAVQHHAEQGQSVASRVMALKLLTTYADQAPHSGPGLLPIARDARVPINVRAQALRALARLPLDPPGARALLELLHDAEPRIAELALHAIESHAQHLDHTAVKPLLLPLLTSPHREVRCRAIDLLGHFGEVDVIEHVCALPLVELQDLDAVQNMVKRMLSKPRSVLHVSPTSFEHLIKRLLLAMDFEDVKVTGGVRDDGIDLKATREESESGFAKQRRPYIIQCKRHQGSIGAPMVKEFIATLQSQHAAKGLFITTSTFTPEAREANRAYNLRLVDCDELQGLLDQHFGSGSYRIAAAA